MSDASRLIVVENENTKLKRLVGEQLLVIEGLKEFSGKKNESPDWSARGVVVYDELGAVGTRGLPACGMEPARRDL